MEDHLPSLIEHFEELEDPRVEGRSKHKLIDIVVIMICGTIANADSWREIQDYANHKRELFERFLELPHGIPSSYTFRRLMGVVRPESVQSCFVAWTQTLVKSKRREILALDGKTARRSGSPSRGKKPIHIVSAWAVEAGLVLGQEACAEKSNEITAVPKLLNMLDLKKKIVTTDALGTQKAIAKQVREAGGDYVFALKDNHRTLYRHAQWMFENAKAKRWTGVKHSTHRTEEIGHGRHEVRKYWMIHEEPASEWLAWRLFKTEPWKDLKGIGVVESRRTINGVATKEMRYYLTSLENDAELLARAVRGHWGVGNNLHWMLDVVFREDDDRNRTGHAQENLSVCRKAALNLLKLEKTHRGSIKGKRKQAGWDDNYLMKVLGVSD